VDARRDQDELVEEMSAALDGHAGHAGVFTQPIEMRVNEMVAGIRADVGIKLFGDDFDVLVRRADEIRARREDPRARRRHVEQLTGQAMLVIDVDREAPAATASPSATILEVIDSLGTRKVGEVIEGQRRFDLVLRSTTTRASSRRQIGRVLIRTSAGRRCRCRGRQHRGGRGTVDHPARVGEAARGRPGERARP
jgi:cobalt-zinc-cadmium resistance protein CzcA